MKMKALRLAVGLAVAALGSIAISGTANASALLQIVPLGEIALGQEVTGDPGGTVYPYPGGPGPGAGVPSSPLWTPAPGPGFAPDPSFGGALGTSGFHSGYLFLTAPSDVTFQYMGGGNSTINSEFWVNGAPIFIDNQTNPCAVAAGATAPTCIANQNEVTIPLNAGLIPFQYRIDASGVFLDNTGAGLGNPDPHNAALNQPGYFLGADPYLAVGQFDTTGKVMYAGLSDLPGPGDHDFQDLGVRISVPEPGTLLLLGSGLMGLGAFRRRKA